MSYKIYCPQCSPELFKHLTDIEKISLSLFGDMRYLSCLHWGFNKSKYTDKLLKINNLAEKE